jgi:hypothetical protein
MIRQVTVLIAFAATLALLLPAATASARSWRSRTPAEVTWYQYAAPFTCGLNVESDDRAVPGLYATAINSHNPHAASVIIRKHAALTFPPEEQAAGAVSEVIREILPGRSALQVDCGEFRSDDVFIDVFPLTDFAQGFVVIASRRPLDVSATYTVTGDDDEQASVDVETIAERTLTRPAASDELIVCHVPPGNPDNEHEIPIDEDAWPAHRAHGDRRGDCDDD